MMKLLPTTSLQRFPSKECYVFICQMRIAPDWCVNSWLAIRSGSSSNRSISIAICNGSGWRGGLWTSTHFVSIECWAKAASGKFVHVRSVRAPHYSNYASLFKLYVIGINSSSLLFSPTISRLLIFVITKDCLVARLKAFKSLLSFEFIRRCMLELENEPFERKISHSKIDFHKINACQQIIYNYNTCLALLMKSLIHTHGENCSVLHPPNYSYFRFPLTEMQKC